MALVHSIALADRRVCTDTALHSDVRGAVCAVSTGGIVGISFAAVVAVALALAVAFLVIRRRKLNHDPAKVRHRHRLGILMEFHRGVAIDVRLPCVARRCCFRHIAASHSHVFVHGMTRMERMQGVVTNYNNFRDGMDADEMARSGTVEMYVAGAAANSGGMMGSGKMPNGVVVPPPNGDYGGDRPPTFGAQNSFVGSLTIEEQEPRPPAPQ